MRARLPLTSKQRKAAAYVAKAEIERQLEDTALRAQYLWMMCMIRAGLSPRTIERVKKELPEVTAAYAELQTDKLADMALIGTLERRGVTVPELKEMR